MLFCLIGKPCGCATCQKPHVLQLVIYAAFHRRTLRRAYKLGAIHPLESPGLLLDRLARRIDNQINNFARN